MSTRHDVLTEDGVSIAVQEGGSSRGRPVVLLHGIAQSAGAWRAVFEGPLAETHRLLAVDMRGHGESSTPDGSEAYASGDRLGADLHAVIDRLGLVSPVVVAWSYGGVMVGEYLRRQTAKALGGILFVAAAVRVGKLAASSFGPGMTENARALLSPDPARYEEGARAFVRACAAEPLSDGFVEAAVRAMMRVPVHVRRALLTRSEDYSPEIAACDVPMATLHGSRDSIVLPTMSEEIGALRSNVEQRVVDDVGHVPWIEAPAQFEAAVRALVARATPI